MTEEKCVYAELIHRPQLYAIMTITNNGSSVFVQQSSQPAYIDQTLAPQQGRSTQRHSDHPAFTPPLSSQLPPASICFFVYWGDPDAPRWLLILTAS